jgi:hypothetical protein
MKDKIIEVFEKFSRSYGCLIKEDWENISLELVKLFCQPVDRWIDANEAQPLLVGREDYSPNVLAICNGQLMVMCYCYNPSEDDAERGFFWVNCNGNIDGEAEFDDEYDVTFWQYLPSIEGFVA